MNIVIGSDHAGFELKDHIKNSFNNKVIFKDVGTNSVESVDYPDYAHLATKEFTENNHNFIILICGSGNGIQMSANKHQNIRCALCWNKEIAELARSHNDANAIALPARYITNKEAIQIITTFIDTNFEGGRHERRKDKISCA
jgi:ribose 5-phosphate isomerase B